MSNYEFWDELGKIFNAVVAYQEKTIEFNKRFINPWIRLGNVFDKQDRNEEAICAYQKAIEIKPDLVDAHLNLASVSLDAGAVAEAEAAVLAAVGGTIWGHDDDTWPDVLGRQLAERGWAARDAQQFRLTPQGLRFADSAAELFLR